MRVDEKLDAILLRLAKLTDDTLPAEFFDLFSPAFSYMQMIPTNVSSQYLTFTVRASSPMPVTTVELELTLNSYRMWHRRYVRPEAASNAP